MSNISETMSKLLFRNFCKLSQLVKNYTTFVSLPPRKCGINDRGTVIGVYSPDNDEFGILTTLSKTGSKLNQIVDGKLWKFLNYARPAPKVGEVRILYGVHDDYPQIAVVGVGDPCLCYNPVEQVDERKEAIRIAAATGVQALQELDIERIAVESFEHAESAAEGAHMGVWLYQDNKTKCKQKNIPYIDLFDSCDTTGWQIGLEKATAQNTARKFSEIPANILTPGVFAESVVELLSRNGVNVQIRVKRWAELRNMNAFLAVERGSCEPGIFLELLYEGCDPNIPPIVIIGKGLTFDTGGLNLKTPDDMQHQQGDITGAACVVATLNAVARLGLPINIKGLIPVAVNSFGQSAIKPGDVIRAMNGKTILIENTDHAEGVLMHADALVYAQEFCPKLIVDVGTMTEGMVAGMGSAACGVFSNNESLYEAIRIASIHTGDRVWPFPMWEYFKDYTRSSISDLTNSMSGYLGGGPGRAAAFLAQFIPNRTPWVHIDTYNVRRTTGKCYAYLREGMTGRPTRTLIEFFAQLCCKRSGFQQ